MYFGDYSNPGYMGSFFGEEEPEIAVLPPVVARTGGVHIPLLEEDKNKKRRKREEEEIIIL